MKRVLRQKAHNKTQLGYHGVNATFGNGVHLCPGAYLAQLEMEIFLSEWINRIPAFRLQPDSFPKMSSGILGAMLEVKLRW